MKNLNLISQQESRELFEKQTVLLQKFSKSGDAETLLKVAILQTLVPICDVESALKIIKTKTETNFEYLVVGAYLSSENYASDDKEFLLKLKSDFFSLSTYQKSIVKYLHALYLYKKESNNLDDIIAHLNDSIDLCDNYPANYYLRFLVLQDKKDLIKAKDNVEECLTDNDIKSLSIDCMIEPVNFIDEHVLMKKMPLSTFEAIFNNAI